MKKSFLFLLPLAMIAVSCNGLQKGNIFNEKFMKRNFAEREVATESFEAPRKVTLDLGAGVTAVADQGTQGILTVSKADDNKGLFCVYNNKYVLPVDKYDAGSLNVVSDNTINRKFFYGKKTVDAKQTIYVYDEDGNKLYEGEFGALNVIGSQIARSEVEGNEHSVAQINVGGVTRAYAIYNVDRTLKEVLSEEDYLNKHSYVVNGINLSAYGHKDVILTQSAQAGIGTRYAAFNEKKGKFVSSFVIPNDAAMTIRVGNHMFYQTIKPLNEREKKYDFYNPDDDTKYNYETYKVDYMTGKQSKINTKIIFAAMTGMRDLYNNKNFIDQLYINGIREVLKGKILSSRSYGYVLNDNLKKVADVSGINLNSLKEFGDYYISNANIVYDSKLKEVGQSTSAVTDKHIVAYGGGVGLIDHTGKFIYRPVAQQIVALTKGYYVALFANKLQVLKMSDKEKVEIAKEIESTQYTYTAQTKSKAHVALANNEAKAFVLDVTSGEVTEAPVKATEDVFVTQFSAKFNGGSLEAEGTVYKSGESYYVLRDSTQFAYSYLKLK